jgi:hypothetical protein
MATTEQFLAKNDMLYNLFVEHVKNEIRKSIEPEVKRMVENIVDTAIDQAAASMQGQLQQYYDPSSFMKTVKVIVVKK